MFVRDVREPGRYVDVHGLPLVTSSGVTRWIQRLVTRGRHGNLNLGPVSLVSLA